MLFIKSNDRPTWWRDIGFTVFFFADRTDIKSLIRQAVVHGVPAKPIDYISPYGWKGWERITVRYRLIFNRSFFALFQLTLVETWVSSWAAVY